MCLDFDGWQRPEVNEWQAKDWETFRRGQFRAFFYADEAAADTIWSLIQEYQK